MQIRNILPTEKPAPKISIVIPLYNKEPYIKRTLNSVLSQTFTNYECIIIDSSDDGSTDIVKTYNDPRFNHIILKPRTSHSHARNLGIDKAQTDFVAFLDADDEWLPDHLEALVELYHFFPDAGIYATPYIKIRDNGKQRAMIFAEIPPPPWKGYIRRYFLTCARGDVPIHSSGCAIHKRIFDEIGGFDENLVEIGEDQHLWARIALNYPIAFTWRGSAIYHTEASGRICNEPRKVNPVDPLNLFLKEVIDTGKISPERTNDIQAYIARRNKMLIMASLLNNGNQGMKKSRNVSNNCLSHIATLVGLAHSTSSVIRIIYGSEFHNICIRIWCYIHGWYVPDIRKIPK